MTLVERCYDDISVITSGSSASAAEFGDVVVDVSTCVLVRDVSLLSDSHQSQSFALTVSSLAAKFTRCCVILTDLHTDSSSHPHNPAYQE